MLALSKRKHQKVTENNFSSENCGQKKCIYHVAHTVGPEDLMTLVYLWQCWIIPCDFSLQLTNLPITAKCAFTFLLQHIIDLKITWR